MIWLIEMYENGKWMPTVGAYLTRAAAREGLVEWKENNPTDFFRIRRYMEYIPKARIVTVSP